MLSCFLGIGPFYFKDPSSFPLPFAFCLLAGCGPSVPDDHDLSGYLPTYFTHIQIFKLFIPRMLGHVKNGHGVPFWNYICCCLGAMMLVYQRPGHRIIRRT